MLLHAGAGPTSYSKSLTWTRHKDVHVFPKESMYTSSRMAKIKLVITPNAGKDAGKLNHSYIAGENVNW